MAIATFAGKTFQVSGRKVYTIDNFKLSSSLNTESQDAIGKKPSTYIKGPGLDPMSFNIPLNYSLGTDPLAEYNSWKAILEKSVAYPFILGGKPVGSNKWLLKSVNMDNINMDSKGFILSGILQLEFEEYIRQGSQNTQSSTSASGSGTKNYVNTLVSDKPSKKRINTNAAAAKRRILVMKNINN